MVPKINLLRSVMNGAALVLLFCLSSFIPQSGATSQNADLKFLPAIRSQVEFDQLARVYTDTSYVLPHVLFVIDRKENNKIYYVNTQRYRFHQDFVNATYLSLDRGEDFTRNNYLNPNRRFIMGTVAYQTPVRRFAFEFWEGDTISGDQIKLAFDIINKSFFIPVVFKPNSLKQDEESAGVAGLARVLPSDIAKQQEYEPLNVARGLGRIHIIPKLNEHVEIGFNEIIVLNEVPVHLPPLAGI